MSRRLQKPNASRTADGLTVGQLDVLGTACEDDDGDVYIASSSGRPQNMIEKGWLVKSPGGGYRVFRVTAAGRQRYAAALAKQQEGTRDKAARPRCDLCGRPCSGKHIDPVSNKPRHPACVPF